jgi:hypothetical protein
MIFEAFPLLPCTIGIITPKLESLYALRPIGTDIRSIATAENNNHNIVNNASAVIVGKKKDRRRLNLVSYNQQMRLEALQSQHRKLDEQLKESAKSYRDFSSIKQLKATRLRLKDDIQRLCNHLSLQQKESAPSSNISEINKTCATNGDGYFNDFKTMRKMSSSLLGIGSYAQVLHGTNLATGRQVAIKVTDSHEELHREFLILDRLKHMKGFARPHYFGRQDVMNLGCMSVLVMDLLGPSLESLLFATTLGTRGFSSITVLQIARQLIERLLSLQRCGIVHGDLHCGNLLMGLDGHSATGNYNNNRTIYLVDFGRAGLVTLKDKESLLKKLGKEKLLLKGEDVESSLASTDQTNEESYHGEVVGEFDDLNSLISVLLELLTGSQPSCFIDSHSSTTSFQQLLASCFHETQDDRSMSCLAMTSSANLLSEMWDYRQSLHRGNNVDYAMLLTRVDTFLKHEAEASEKFNDYDWEIQGLHWSSDDGVLHHKLYED